MAPSRYHERPQEGMFERLPSRRIRFHHNPYVFLPQFQAYTRYPSGQIGFMVCCKDATRNVSVPIRSWDEKEEEKLCRYYNKDIHSAAFVLPTWVRSALKAVKKD